MIMLEDMKKDIFIVTVTTLNRKSDYVRSFLQPLKLKRLHASLIISENSSCKSNASYVPVR